MIWRLSPSRTVSLDSPCIMAILNVTPDSFSDGGVLALPAAAANAAERAVQEGAHILDIGGESTRPGSTPVGAEEQIRRVVPAIIAIRQRLPGVPMTIDTTLASVAAAALDAGGDAINDTTAGLGDPGMLALAAERDCGIVLMHRPRPARRDQYSDSYTDPPTYRDAVADVTIFLMERGYVAEATGIARDGIVIDPGLGFGKTVEQNIALIRGTQMLTSTKYPVLSGLSRKSFVGRVGLGRDSLPAERVAATVAMSVEHWRAGARIFRVHDVAEHVRAFSLLDIF